MSTSDQQKKIKEVGSAGVLRLGLSHGVAPSPEELRALLEDRLAESLEIDLGSLSPDLLSQVKVKAEREGLVLKSVRDLLEHPHPPLHLLELIKNFEKSRTEYSDPAVPRDVALVLYYSLIAAAYLRCGQGVSSLSRSELRRGIEWALAQPWIDETCRKVLADYHTSSEQRSNP